MKKIEAIQKRKSISAYGGSGSIIETLNNGSLLILPYDQWPCFSQAMIGNCREINNPRLRHKVNEFPGYGNIGKLIEVPTPRLGENESVYNPYRETLLRTINAQFFPEWFYCTKCRRLKRISQWEVSWKERFPTDKKFKENPPACPYCSRPSGRGISRKPLQQLRFMMASLDGGKMTDIPFDKILSMPRDSMFWCLDGNTPDNAELSYHTSKGTDGLQSIYIKRDDNNDPVFLSTINSKYLYYSNGDKKGAYRVKLRNGSDVYYPNILSCIYIPQPTPEQINSINKLVNRGFDAQNIYEIIGGGYGLSLQQIQDIIDDVGQGNDQGEFEMSEFYYITNHAIYNQTTHKRAERDFKAIYYPNLRLSRIKGFYALTQLKETSVLLSYNLVSNNSKDWLNIDTLTIEETNPKTVYPFKNPNNTDFMPAVDLYGEGLLFELDATGIPNSSDRLVFAHTFCHLIMKELEFLCGYPVTSLKERIYQNGDSLGFLIYTIQGSEGSYGGLTSLLPHGDTNANNAKLLKVVATAAERAKDCPNDPICMHENKHCFACVDLPETSCQLWNNNLSRDVFLRYIYQQQTPNTLNPTPNLAQNTIILDD